MQASVIIPTYNRCDTLLDCLHALERQTCNASAFDVIVSDDGSTDATEQRLAALDARWGGRLRYVRQPNHGPAAARNLGASLSCADLLLFLGDDIIATPDLVEQHMLCHRQNSDQTVAVLGKTEWSPTLQVTALMRWMDQSGDQFDFATLEYKEPTFWHFYSSNLSLKRTFFARHDGFDEDFPYAAFEDSELGFRLKQDGMRILYQPAALAYHDHPTTFESHRQRAAKVGISAYIMERKHPGLFKRPRLSWKSLVKRIALVAGPLIVPFGPEQIEIWVHRIECERLFWQGFDQQAARERLT